MLWLVLAAGLAALFSVGGSFLMTKASDVSAAWNIAIGATVALALALVLLVAVLVLERMAFP